MKLCSRALVLRSAVLLVVCSALLSVAGCKSVRLPADQPPPPGYLSGCYVDVYDQVDFKGNVTRYWGPAGHAKLVQGKKNTPIEVRSVIVGPQAHARLINGALFQGQFIWLRPGQEVADLGKLNFDRRTVTLEVIATDKVRAVE